MKDESCFLGLKFCQYQLANKGTVSKAKKKKETECTSKKFVDDCFLLLLLWLLKVKIFCSIKS